MGLTFPPASFSVNIPVHRGMELAHFHEERDIYILRQTGLKHHYTVLNTGGLGESRCGHEPRRMVNNNNKQNSSDATKSDTRNPRSETRRNRCLCLDRRLQPDT